MHSCPNRSASEALKKYGSFYRAFRWLEEKSILPIDAGLMDQSASFVRAHDFLKQYQAVYFRMLEDGKKKFSRVKKKKV